MEFLGVDFFRSWDMHAGIEAGPGGRTVRVGTLTDTLNEREQPAGSINLQPISPT